VITNCFGAREAPIAKNLLRTSQNGRPNSPNFACRKPSCRLPRGIRGPGGRQAGREPHPRDSSPQSASACLHAAPRGHALGGCVALSETIAAATSRTSCSSPRPPMHCMCVARNRTRSVRRAKTKPSPDWRRWLRNPPWDPPCHGLGRGPERLEARTPRRVSGSEMEDTYLPRGTRRCGGSVLGAGPRQPASGTQPSRTRPPWR